MLLPAERYEALIDELEDLRIDAIAAERPASFDRNQAISHEDMLSRFDTNAQIEQ